MENFCEGGFWESLGMREVGGGVLRGELGREGLVLV